MSLGLIIPLAPLRPMTDEFSSKLDRILEDTTRIKTALWPDEGQPGVLTQHEERLDKLEQWRNWLAGASAVISTFFGIHLGGGKH
jgi:hypothetical protein